MIKKIFSYLKKPKLLERLWKKFLLLFFFEQWSLLVSNNNNDEMLTTWSDFKLLRPPKDRFWADPFPWHVNGEDFVFYEEMPFNTMKGHISCIKLGKNLEILLNEVVLECPYHLSYPFLFEYDEQLYMVPETRQNHQIEIYHCKQFPSKWKKAGTLIAGVDAVDATLLEFNGKWWLFTNVIEAGGNAYDSLHLYHANSPLSNNWIPHPLNPIVRNIQNARPAGRIFKKGSDLIRPSQDCSSRYGYAINFNRIEELSDKSYREIRLKTFIPPNDNSQILATHTWNNFGSLKVIDAEYWRRR